MVCWFGVRCVLFVVCCLLICVRCSFVVVRYVLCSVVVCSLLRVVVGWCFISGALYVFVVVY